MKKSKPADYSSLKNHFLVATPELTGTPFANAVIYICEHAPDGAMGLVINQPMDIPLRQIFDQFELDYEEHRGEQPVLSGGPVQVDRGFILHRPADKSWEATMPITENVSLTSSKDIISDLALNSGPSPALIVLGYSGWSAGQLEQELTTNAWLTIPANNEILFDTPFEHRAKSAAASIGVDLHRLSRVAGHA